MKSFGFRVGENPVADGEIAGVGMDRKRQLYGPGLRDGREASAVNLGDAPRTESCFAGPALLLEEVGPTQAEKRLGPGGVEMLCDDSTHGTIARSGTALAVKTRR